MFRAGLFACAAAAILAWPGAARVSSQADEVRALWVLRSTLESPERIRAMVASAAASGFNTLFVQVRGRGDAYFNDGVEVRAASLTSQDDGFDPLAETLQQAHARGLRVHAWVNVNLVASASAFPASRQHVIYRHPDWLMVPRELAVELRDIDPGSPEYLGRLSRWTRAAAARVEGLYLSPVHQGAHLYTADVVRDLVTRYAVDGVHLDYIRYPGPDFDYSRGAVDAFRQEMRRTLPRATIAALDATEALDPFAYPNQLEDEWRRFRQSQLTSLMARLYTTIRQARPDAVVSAAVAPDADAARRDKLQDWRTWIETGFLDAICPMAYTTEAPEFARQVREVRALAAGRPVWVGIGAYQMPARDTIANIATARRLGAAGVILFSYDSLTGPPNGDDYLSAVARALTGGL